MYNACVYIGGVFAPTYRGHNWRETVKCVLENTVDTSSSWLQAALLDRSLGLKWLSFDSNFRTNKQSHASAQQCCFAVINLIVPKNEIPWLVYVSCFSKFIVNYKHLILCDMILTDATFVLVLFIGESRCNVAWHDVELINPVA